MSNPSNYVSPPRYQKDVNIKGKAITDDYKDIWKVLKKLPDLPALDIAGAEGFISHLARKAGIRDVTCIEIGENKIKLGRKHFIGIKFICGDIFSHFELVRKSEIFIISRFFHNIGPEWSEKLMEALNRPCIIVARHKRGDKRENGRPRQPLAMRRGVVKLLEKYGFRIRAYGDTVLAAKGEKYESCLAD